MKKRLLFAFLSLVAVFAYASDKKGVFSLNGEWVLDYWAQPKEAIRSPHGMSSIKYETISAEVPGNVEIDLEKAGKIADPMIGSNIYLLRKYEGYQWCYTKHFPTPDFSDNQTVRLFFGGIDCFADVWLNGKKIGEADNMLIEHQYDVTDYLNKGGENELKVILRSAVIESSKYRIGAVSVKKDGNSESEYVRKAPHSYGWDILPRLVSAGIWRDVELQVIDEVNFDNVFWFTRSVNTKKRTADITLDYQLNMPFELFDKLDAEITLSRNGKVAYKSKQPVASYVGRFFGRVENVDLWWPLGYGEPALYDAEIVIKDSKGKVYAYDKKKIGLRTVELDRTELTTLENRGKFNFLINGEHVFIKGTNWVPVDALHSRDEKLIDDVLEMMKDINCNMVRCWGGNVYEDHKFYDFCDANGILVWQDFSMGCTTYPQRNDFLNMIEEEVTSVVVKLRNHCSIALWAGNNENDVALTWQGMDALKINPNKDYVSRIVIPKVLWEFDPTRDYLPSSPYLSEIVFAQETELKSRAPEQHLWGPRGYYKDPFYSNNSAHFASEIGYHGCPNKESLEKMFTKECIYPWTSYKEFAWNDEWLTKSVRCMPESKATEKRNYLMTNQINYLFGEVPEKLESFIMASQIVQAEAKKYFIEFFRGKKGDRSGILWWNLRDGWPVVSDAIVDYYNSKKLAYDYIKNAQTNVCVLMNDAVNGVFPLTVVNDTRKSARGEVVVKDVATNKVVYTGSYELDGNGIQTIANIHDNGGQGVYQIEYTVDGNKYNNHYLYGKAPFKFSDYISWMKKTSMFSKISKF